MTVTEEEGMEDATEQEEEDDKKHKTDERKPQEELQKARGSKVVGALDVISGTEFRFLTEFRYDSADSDRIYVPDGFLWFLMGYGYTIFSAGIPFFSALGTVYVFYVMVVLIT